MGSEYQYNDYHEKVFEKRRLEKMEQMFSTQHKEDMFNEIQMYKDMKEEEKLMKLSMFHI